MAYSCSSTQTLCEILLGTEPQQAFCHVDELIAAFGGLASPDAVYEYAVVNTESNPVRSWRLVLTVAREFNSFHLLRLLAFNLKRQFSC